MEFVALRSLIVAFPCHIYYTGDLDKKISVEVLIFSYPSVLTRALCAEKKRLNETVL